jgi:hypothetical protein
MAIVRPIKHRTFYLGAEPMNETLVFSCMYIYAIQYLLEYKYKNCRRCTENSRLSKEQRVENNRFFWARAIIHRKITFSAFDFLGMRTATTTTTTHRITETIN